MEGLIILLILGWMIWRLLSSPLQSLSFITKGLGLLVLGMGALIGMFALVLSM